MEVATMAPTFSIFLSNFGVNTAPRLFWALFAFAIAVPLISMTRAKTAINFKHVEKEKVTDRCT